MAKPKNVKIIFKAEGSTPTRRMSAKQSNQSNIPKPLIKEMLEESGSICRQPFENRKKNPARFNKKKKF